MAVAVVQWEAVAVAAVQWVQAVAVETAPLTGAAEHPPAGRLQTACRTDRQDHAI